MTTKAEEAQAELDRGGDEVEFDVLPVPEEWGPYDEYITVDTPHGKYGLPAHHILSFTQGTVLIKGHGKEIETREGLVPVRTKVKVKDTGKRTPGPGYHAAIARKTRAESAAATAAVAAVEAAMKLMGNAPVPPGGSVMPAHEAGVPVQQHIAETGGV